MREIASTVEFWVAMVLAIAVKIGTSERLSPLKVLITIVTSVTAALVFTIPVADALNIDSQSGRYAVAALIGITFESISRQLVVITLGDVIGAFVRRK